jgi:hypothetical protein
VWSITKSAPKLIITRVGRDVNDTVEPGFFSFVYRLEFIVLYLHSPSGV